MSKPHLKPSGPGWLCQSAEGYEGWGTTWPEAWVDFVRDRMKKQAKAHRASLRSLGWKRGMRSVPHDRPTQ